MNRRHSFTLILLVALLSAGTLVVPSGTTDAGMTSYCQVPPYVIQNIPPNVLILFDISGSMLNLAYRDGYQTPTNTADDHACTSTDPCTQYNWSGRPSSHRYYGYFDPNQWYTYASNVFTPAGPKSGSKQSNYWSGDLRTGHDAADRHHAEGPHGGTTHVTKIDGQPADDPVRGLYKQITATEASANTPEPRPSISSSTRGPPDLEFDVRPVSNGIRGLDRSVNVTARSRYRGSSGRGGRAGTHRSDVL